LAWWGRFEYIRCEKCKKVMELVKPRSYKPDPFVLPKPEDNTTEIYECPKCGHRVTVVWD